MSQVELSLNFEYCRISSAIWELMGAISGLFEEGARQRGIKMCIVRQDLMDPTSISRKDMRRDVNVFMQNVMGEEPLDPTLVDFDDDLSW